MTCTFWVMAENMPYKGKIEARYHNISVGPSVQDLPLPALTFMINILRSPLTEGGHFTGEV